MTAEEKAREYASLLQDLFNHMYEEHGLLLTQSQMQEIIRISENESSSLSQYQEVLKELINQIEDWKCDHKSSYDGKEQIPTSVFRETVEKAKQLMEE